MEPIESQIAAFVKAGNTFEGDIPRTIGLFELFYKGSGNTLVIGQSCTFTHLRLGFEGHGGRMAFGDGAVLKGYLIAGTRSSLSIGAQTFLNRPCDLRAMEGASIAIGENCLFSNVVARTSDLHSVLNVETGKRTNPAQGIVVEDYVWLAEDVKIAKGVRVGYGSIVGSGSIVTGSVAPMCLSIGRPAKVVRSGVTWSRKLAPMKALPAREFQADDIPFNYAVIRRLVVDKKFKVVIDVIEKQLVSLTDYAALPNYAQWYLVMSRDRLKCSRAEDIEMLNHIVLASPDHTSAVALRKKLLAAKLK